MIDTVRSSEPLQPVRAVRRSDGGTDIWLRKSIRGPITGEDGDVFYEAEEAFLRTTEEVSTEAAKKDFDGYWRRAAAYEPHLPPLSDEERIAQLEEKNAMLAACLLEMSEIVYA